jgi:hypothetical protein
VCEEESPAEKEVQPEAEDASMDQEGGREETTSNCVFFYNDGMQSDEEECEEEPPESPQEVAENAMLVCKAPTLASEFEQVAVLKQSGRLSTITLDDARRQLDQDLADLTEDEKKHLQILYHPKMLAATAEDMAEQCANLPPKETITWLTRRPNPLVVYKHMPAQRKLEWLLYRAREANLEKTPECFPTFIGFFKDLAPIADANSCLQQA